MRLAFPHMKGEDSELMTSHGFGGQCKGKQKIKLCNFTDYDFERFLWPYKPRFAESRASYEARRKIEDRIRSEWACPPRAGFGRSGLDTTGCIRY